MRRSPGKTWRVIGSGVLAAAALVVSGCVSDAVSRQSIDIETFLMSDETDWPPFNDAQVVTDSLCSGLSGCEQAVEGTGVTVIKFNSVDAADAFIAGSEAPDELEQIDPIVVDFRGGDLDAQTREEIVGTLSNLNASSPD